MHRGHGTGWSGSVVGVLPLGGIGYRSCDLGYASGFAFVVWERRPAAGGVYGGRAAASGGRSWSDCRWRKHAGFDVGVRRLIDTVDVHGGDRGASVERNEHGTPCGDVAEPERERGVFVH